MTHTSVTLRIPTHITGFFSVHRADAPERSGSRGAGITLTEPVSVEVLHDGNGITRLNGSSTTVEAVEVVKNRMQTAVSIEVETKVPIGAGFGVSGALALGTAFGINQFTQTKRTQNELVTIAHVADVESGTGLGDVVAQAYGGIPLRLEPGAPGYGVVDGIPASRPIEYVSFGELSTPDILEGDTSLISEAGEAALESVQADPTLETVMQASRSFAQQTGLLTERIRTVIEDVEAVGGHASMAMLGQTVFAIDTGLSTAGYNPHRCEVASAGIEFISR